MIEKLKVYEETPSGYKHPENTIQDKINELVDAINELQTRAENVQPDYVTITYMTDGHTKEYYGRNGASIVTDYPLPAGYVITIREAETKGGDNE